MKQCNKDYTRPSKACQDATTAALRHIPEAISQGSTEEELLDNIREAIELVLADRQESIHRQYAGRNYIRRRIAVGV